MARAVRQARGGPPPLVETKLLVPPGRPELVARRHLLRALDDSSSTTLTLLSAPVGFGKTVLVQSWCASTKCAVAWVTVDAGDDDAQRFWTYVATAVDRVRPGLGRLALMRLRSGGPVQPAVDEIVNGISAYGEPLTMVFDDLHLVQDDAVLGSLSYLVEHLPGNAHLVVTTRSDPDLKLGRLRAQGTLRELRARELAFTLDEARELLVEREGIPLDDDDLELLLDRTEGWPAGLYLAALWLRQLDRPAEGVRDFHGDHRHVADYLTTEVLDTLEASTRDFLLRTSVLGRFDAELCDAVLERDDAAAVLAELERFNLFLVPLDPQRRWYRYHHLFGELLALELASVDPSAPEELRRRAFDWCRRHAHLDDAFEHATALGDDAAVADLLVENHRPLMMTGRQETILRWVGKLPSEVLLEHPVLPPTAAMAARMVGRPAEQAHRYMALAEKIRAERPDAWTSYEDVLLRIARLGWIERDVSAALHEARTTLDDALAGQEVFVVPALAALALTSFYSGDREAARDYAVQAIDRADAEERAHGYAYAHSLLALLDADEGNVASAQVHSAAAATAVERSGLQETTTGGIVLLARAVADEAAGKSRDAQHSAVGAERLCRQHVPEATHLYALVRLARIHVARGELDQAESELAKARQGLESFSDAGVLPQLAARVERSLEQARRRVALPSEPPSDAELNVLRLLSSDLTRREIGERLFISVNTVKTHTRTLYRKLGVASREEAVAQALALGLLDETESPG